MLPMKADLQELMITEGEIKKIVGKFSSSEIEALLSVAILVGWYFIFFIWSSGSAAASWRK